MFFHTYNIEMMGEMIIFPYIKMYGGYLGNYLFFVLSGLMIAYNYKEKVSTEEVDFRTYFVKRLIKIYPLFLVTNLAALMIEIWVYGIERFNIKEFLLVFFMQTGGALEDIYPYNSPAWFICTLMVCYCIYYLISYYSVNETKYYFYVIAMIIWGYILLNRNWDFPYMYNHNGEGFFNFFFGCLLMEIFLKINKKYKRYVYAGSIVILGFILYCSWKVSFSDIVGDIRIVVSVLICPIILFWAMENNLCKKVLSIKPVFYIGKISMSIYLWHMVIYRIVFILYNKLAGLTYCQAYVVYLIILFTGSSLSYCMIEKKFLNYLQKRFIA